MNKGQDFWKERVKEGAVLNPVDRISEVLFGLIMVLTFTGTISVTTDGRQEVRELLWAALGCNLAWGLVDAIMYLMNVLLERGHGLFVLNRIAGTDDAMSLRKILKEEIQPVISGLMSDDELDQLSDRLKKLPVPSKRNLLTRRDFFAGTQIFLLVFLCTLPVALPFAFLTDVAVAMRVSNGVALLLLFVGGFILAKYAGFRRLITALAYVVIGILLVALTMALGG
ncbi:MAG TPA: VIT1/CCC1 transporter family protein [Cyclobacteriaceae bacterium]|nr:VIT1/CCC1 transporter family protein [Cyclobacteriaceae bacterium]